VRGASPDAPATTRLLVAAYLPVLLGGCLWIVLRDGGAGLAGLVVDGRPLVSLAAGLVLGGLVSLVQHTPPVSGSRQFRRMRRFFRLVLGHLRPGDAWMLAIVSAIAEEIMFRGALQPAIGCVAAGLLFGVLHIPPDRRLLAWPLYATILGLALGGIYAATGNLIGPILAHFLINLVSLRKLAETRAPTRSSK
jgi:CAAX protease family protein